ncbi:MULTISPECIES: hypothetical protein [Streptomyces]|uniref:Uncharacterized protein n=1 Tax=Streptomyces tsukubensis (strain DSM 42081 / NBRC 108919 / NRRL 18488 / 9993) TaxID=1114943 RepID=I2N936_STRT9|nr:MULTISPECIES: hypothetical protein [Streptomyces]AZK97382.1 hypothetical protein B7R87_28485 [Streptomyces tsukubensis]EIF93533.1 hypothetical protein [Streptomyces tsukubensis NRRL18488]MYS65231.1 hypothetical protein [Streptomyces sp. SID5473]QKM66662.1 hypothetical protein STSU_005295 [Streptomyces tsukubensis NRRL18488]TAI44992.1 hypothetical protein EWI31_06930 [Streptomyces tsukubensis]
MALAKKGSRRIVVDGVEYRWRVSRKHWCCDYEGSTVGYVAEDATRPGTTLVVETGRPAVLNPDMVPTEVVLPREVAAGIRAARSKGWTPGSNGSPFKLHLSAA